MRKGVVRDDRALLSCKSVMVPTEMTARIALVTGASSGIGQEFAEHYARRGFHIVLVGRNVEELQRVKLIVETLGGSGESIVADLSQSEGVAHVLAKCAEPDVVVANAGVTMAGRAGNIDWTELQKMSYLIGAGVAQLVEGIVPSMVRRRAGTVIVVSSIASLIDMPNSAVYAASKSFATRYASSLAREVKRSGVQVTAICPGYVHTNLHSRAGLTHLEKTVPGWLWIDAKTVVQSAVNGARKGKVVVVPGLVYRLSLPFLNSSLAQGVWSKLTRRRGRTGPGRT
jgi:short-subunit dehydrogenase